MTTLKVGVTEIHYETCNHCGLEPAKVEIAAALNALAEKERCALCGGKIEIWEVELAHRSKGQSEWYAAKVEFATHYSIEVKTVNHLEGRRAEFWMAKIHEECKEKAFPHLFKEKVGA